MVIVRISAGLGNQMFQYALFCALEEQGVKVKADLSQFKIPKDRRHYELDKVFGLRLPLASPIGSAILQIGSKITHTLFHKPYKETHSQFGTFNPEVLLRRNAYLNGYWQSERYFNQIELLIRDRFQFVEPLDSDNRARLDEIKNCNSVSLHVRRTDFLKQNNWAISPQYYLRAINTLNNKLDEPVYFVFSDDLIWARNQFFGPQFRYVEGNTGARSFRDMQLMSHCRHHIIANSTFSWWGAWLNPFAGKIVIAPDCWQPELQGTRDILPQNWVTLETGMMNTGK